MSKKSPPVKAISPRSTDAINEVHRKFFGQEEPPELPPAKEHFKTLEANMDRNKECMQDIPGAFENMGNFISGARNEANKLHKLFKSDHYLAWRKRIASNPPSADVIAYLLWVHEKYAEIEKSTKGGRATKLPDDKAYARNQWSLWQQNPSRFKNKAAFLKDLSQSTSGRAGNGVSDTHASTWFNELRSSQTSAEWEAIHGQKYPKR